MLRLKFLAVTCATLATFTGLPAHGAAGCTEKVTKAISHSNGQVYFQTDQTCSNSWCQINWGTASNNKNALAMLLSAKLADRPIAFSWLNIASCTDKNVTYASPDYIELL